MLCILLFCIRLIVEVFKDHPGLSGEDPRESGGKKKKGGGKTVSSFYKEQLSNLMTTLHATEPHFIRYSVLNFVTRFDSILSQICITFVIE